MASGRPETRDLRAFCPRWLTLVMVLGLAWLPEGALAATRVKSQASGLCLDVMNANTQEGTPVQVGQCNTGSNQSWDFTPAGELRSFGGARCLSARNQGVLDKTPVVSDVCTGTGNQKWVLGANGSLRGVQSGLCLDVVGDLRQPGTAVQLFACHGRSNQVWLREDAGVADRLAPSAPTGLRVSGLSCQSATLAWSPSTDNVGVAFYDVYRDGQQIVSVPGGVLSTALSPTPGALWGLYVNARDAAGNVSQASPTFALSVPPCVVDTQLPDAPTGLSGVVAGTAATLSWRAATDNVGVVAYDIYRNGFRVGSTTNPSYTVSGLAANVAYRFAVASRDAQGNVSRLSLGITLTTGSTCSSPVCSVAQVAVDSDLPWGLVTLPNGLLIYSRRDAQDLVLLNPASGAKTSLGTVPNVASTDGEGGLLGLAVTPGFPATDPWLYVYHTSATDNRVVRMRYVNGSLDLSSLQVLLAGIGRNKYHNGGRLRFGPDGKLYVATGDAQNSAWAQDINNLAGKILRLNPEGGPPPADNPFGNYVWSYGHRNPQGLAFDAQGRLWQQEFGNIAQDETNLIVKGGNYGWPLCEGTLSVSGGGCQTPGLIAPKMTYSTASGSCSGIAVVRDVLYVACLRGMRVYRHTISGENLINSQELFQGTYGRIRTVEPTRDGGLWMTTSNTGDKDGLPNNSNERVLKVNLGN